MRILTGKRVLLITFLTGLLCGVLYANLIADTYLTTNGIFSSYFLSQYSSTQIDKTEFLFYLLKVRIFPVGILLLAGMIGLKKIASVGVLLWYGFLSGVLLTTSIMQLGLKGLFVSVIALIPQMIFYVLAYAVIVWTLFAWPQVKWTTAKSIFVTLVFVMGILTEVYVSPVLLKLYLMKFS